MDINQEKQSISEALRLRQRAQEDGLRNLPLQNQDANGWGVTGEIISEVHRRGGEELRIWRNMGTSAETKLRDFESKVYNWEGNLPDKAGIRVATRTLEISERQKNGAIAAYNLFKTQNNLIRDASGDDRVAQIIWALIIVIVEGLINGLFFRHASDLGWVGGAPVAFFVSFVNVGFAFVGGALGLRYFANHCNVNKRLGGMFCFLICLAICILTILMSAWFRGHLENLRGINDTLKLSSQALSSQAWADSLASLQHADLWGIISSPEAFLLFFVGALCAFFGFWKGYEYDDSYPGFGVMYRTKGRAEDKYREDSENYEAQNRVYNQHIIGVIQRFTNDFTTIQATMSGLQNAVDTYEDDAWRRLARMLLREYYDHNIRTRTTNAPGFPEPFPGDDAFLSIEREMSDYRRHFLQIQDGFNKARDAYGNIIAANRGNLSTHL